MTRIPYLDSKEGLTPEAADVFEHIEQSRGNVIGVFALLLNSPDVARQVADLGGYLRFDSILPAQLKELIIITTLSENSCQFEWSFHEGFALQAGISPQNVEAIKYKNDVHGNPEIKPEDAEIITYVRDLIIKKRVSDDVFAPIQKRFNTQEITEITALIGYYCMVACQLNAYQLDAPPGKPSLPEPKVT